ncbi:RNA polymerase sigma factor [Chryseobacterium gwangjuense]|uniref:RNA polymerase sigma factor n=1 Tax=Chryseobacterium gwangjuense TaxID=1069980 RepID=UPI001E5534CC|nr:sigma-70 family RNA polymerase sigma factor [Chryseobacterium gwangjuense]MCE3074164.1 sigma-70 family RNA polymerase sigma factor [Chryseobacterium gwangjuense]
MGSFSINFKRELNAFDAFYEKYYKLVFYCITRKVGNVDDVLDISQDVFVHLWEYRKILTSENKERIIYKFCKQFISRYYHTKAKNPIHHATSLEEHSYCDINDEDYEEDHKEQLLKRLANCMEKLSSLQKQIIILHKVDGIRRIEIAELLGIRLSAIKYHLSRSISYLKDCLQSVKNS